MVFDRLWLVRVLRVFCTSIGQGNRAYGLSRCFHTASVSILFFPIHLIRSRNASARVLVRAGDCFSIFLRSVL